MNIPNYWKSTLEDIDNIAQLVQKGKSRVLCQSAGGRNIYLFEYGKKNDTCRMANYNSACAAADIRFYADKSSPQYKPCILLVGAVHGGEFEGTVSLNNLVHMLETGYDFAGNCNQYLKSLAEQVNLLIIPCLNPDGRNRVPLRSMHGLSYEDFRYYSQGTWKSGGLCEWPDCKRVHPIKEAAGYLGAYFNDDGVNLMHDNFFLPMANETRALLALCDSYAPDFTALLHGGANCINCMLKPAYAPHHIKQEIIALEQGLQKASAKRRLKYDIRPLDEPEHQNPPASFNLISAIHHVCGAPCVTYESNQGIQMEGEIYSHDEIYQSHLLMVEEICRFYLRKYPNEVSYD